MNQQAQLIHSDLEPTGLERWLSINKPRRAIRCVQNKLIQRFPELLTDGHTDGWTDVPSFMQERT